jgi:acyl carrier protein
MDAELREQIERREQVVRRLQELLVTRLQLGRDPAELDPDAPLLGGGLDLDSLDALELVVSTEVVFGVRIEDDKTGRMYLRTLNTLADLILAAPQSIGGSDAAGAAHGA